MLISNISSAGWIHTLACIAALLAGGWNTFRAKGTPLHRTAGYAYAGAMVIANVSILAVYHFDIGRFRPFTAGPGVFGIFHWEAVVTLAALALALYAAPRQRRAQWAYVHPFAMLVTYYMLIGGLINELFVRVTPLRALTRGHGAAGFFRTPSVGLAQFAAMLIFFALIVYFAAKVAHYRRRPAATAA